MSVQVSLASSSSDVRHFADFHPTVWGDFFIHYALEDPKMDSWIDELNVVKEGVRKMITSCANKLQVLKLVDAIQRLGIGHHFQTEIHQHLESIFRVHSYSVINVNDLHAIALEFRLLRQQGYYVSTDIFSKFMDEEGRFKENLKDNVRGLLSLYEASFLTMHGEDSLCEARSFAAARLELVAAADLASPVAHEITHALKQPIHRNVNRQEAVHYISMYEQDPRQVEAILKMAKLDFNIAQRKYQQELKSMTMWWKDLNFATKLPFARDRIVEGYFWPLGVHSEQKYEMGRMMFAKFCGICCVIDDTYDAFGTLQELELFTQVVESFEISEKEKLPEYMQVSYEALLDWYKELEEIVAKEGRSETIILCIKELTKKLVRAYLTEARWYNKKYVPTMEEYLENGYATSVHPLLTAISFVGMGEIASKEAFDWLLTEPKILKGSSFVCRLMDDIVSHKFEQSRGHVASAVECYIKQYGVTEDEAYYEINKLVENAWKDMNDEMLKPGDDSGRIPIPLRTCILNLARVIYVLYKDEDTYTHSKHSLKKTLATLLLKPFSL